MSKIFGTRGKKHIRSDVFEIKKYVKKFNIKDLTIGHDSQRNLDEDWVNELVENWDERTCTPIVVVIENDKNLVVDGQHRFKAMENLNYKQVECFVVEGISASEAFLTINNIKPIESMDKFNQKAKTDEYESSIKKLFDDYKIDIALCSVKEDYYFSDVDYLWSIQEEFNELAMEKSLKTITELLEYDGKISKQLLSKMYTIYSDFPEGFEKVYEYIVKLKGQYLSTCLDSKKNIKKLHKRFPKSKIDTELLKLI